MRKEAEASFLIISEHNATTIRRIVKFPVSDILQDMWHKHLIFSDFLTATCLVLTTGAVEEAEEVMVVVDVVEEGVVETAMEVEVEAIAMVVAEEATEVEALVEG